GYAELGRLGISNRPSPEIGITYFVTRVYATYELPATQVEQATSATEGKQVTDQVAVSVALGSRQHRVGSGPVIKVTKREDGVLRIFLGDGQKIPALAVLDHATLVRRSGYDDARTILKALRAKYEGVFAASIRLPGG